MRPEGFLGRVFDRLDALALRVMGPTINRRTVDKRPPGRLTVVAEHDVFSDRVKVIVAAA